MQVGDPTTTASVMVPPIVPAAHQPVRPVADGSVAARDRRETAQQQDRGTSFRAALDAASVGGLGEAFATLAGETPTQSESAPTRAERRPSGRRELDASEADGLYRAAQAQAAPSDAGELHFAREYRSASHEYAQRFFSVGGTFAARGDTLELRA